VEIKVINEFSTKQTLKDTLPAGQSKQLRTLGFRHPTNEHADILVVLWAHCDNATHSGTARCKMP
jgi:hypothetical protein